MGKTDNQNMHHNGRKCHASSYDVKTGSKTGSTHYRVQLAQMIDHDDVTDWYLKNTWKNVPYEFLTKFGEDPRIAQVLQQLFIQARTYAGVKDLEHKDDFRNVSSKLDETIDQLEGTCIDPKAKETSHKIASGIQDIARQFSLFLVLQTGDPGLPQLILKFLGNKLPQRIDQDDHLFQGKAETLKTQHPMQHLSATSRTISVYWFTQVYIFFNTFLKESGILDEMTASLFFRAMQFVGEEFFGEGILLLMDQSMAGPQSEELENSLVIVFAEQLLARIMAGILFRYITGHNKALKDYGLNLKNPHSSKFPKTEKDKTDGEYPTIFADDKDEPQKQLYIEEDVFESAISHSQKYFNFYEENSLKLVSKSRLFFQYKASFKSVSEKPDPQDHSKQKDGDFKKIPPATINISGRDSKSEDKPDSSGLSGKVRGSRGIKIDNEVSPGLCQELPQGSDQVVKTDSYQRVPKCSDQAVFKDSGQRVPKESDQAVLKDSGQEAPSGSGKDVPKVSGHELHKGTGKAVPDDRCQEVHESTDQEVTKDDGQDVPEDSTPKDKEGSDQGVYHHRSQPDHTQLQPQIQPKSQSPLSPGKLPSLQSLGKIEVTNPKRADDGQLPRQERTPREQTDPPQNVQQLKLFAALAWERPSWGYGTESSESSDVYEGWATDSSATSYCGESAAASVASSARTSRTTDDKASSSRSSDTAGESRSGHQVCATAQCISDSPENLASTENTTLTRNEMEISLLRIENVSEFLQSLSDSDGSQTDTFIRFVTPVAVCDPDPEQSQAYREYIPIDSPVHSGVCDRTSSTSRRGSDPMIAHPVDDSSSRSLEERWFLMTERCGPTGFPAHDDVAGISSHPPDETACGYHACQSQEHLTSQCHPDRNLAHTPDHQRLGSVASSHVSSGAPFQASPARVESDSTRPPAGIQLPRPHTQQYSPSLPSPCHEQTTDVRGAIAETGAGSAASSHISRREYPQTARFLPHSSRESGPPTMTLNHASAYSSTQVLVHPAVQTATPSCSSRDAGPAPVLRLQPIVVHAAGDLPPWATTRARIDLSRAVNREYAQLRSRRATYHDDWSYNSGIDPANMALSGFFHQGGERHVRCFYCGLELNPASQDNIWDEHVLRSPDCAYLRAIMGSDVVRRTQEKLTKQKKL